MKWLRRAALALGLLLLCGVGAFLWWPAPAPSPTSALALTPSELGSTEKPKVGLVETVFNALTSANLEGVVTLEGEPVENVQVELLGRKVTTSSKGEFVFRDVPQQEPMVVMAVQGARVARAQVVLTGGKQYPQPLTLALVPAHQLKGQVVNLDDGPIAGATVECSSEKEGPGGLVLLPRRAYAVFGSGGVEMGALEAKTTSDAEGRYVLPLTSGRWTCSAVKTGFAIAGGDDLDVTGDLELELRMADELTLTGDISTSDGALVTDGRVEVLRQMTAAHWVTLPMSPLDAQGRFSVRGLAAGDYAFQVYGPGDRVTPLSHSVPSGPVHWTLPGETILSVVVTDASPNDTVMIQDPESPGSWSGTGIQNGKADFKRLQPGPYRVQLNQSTVDREEQVTKEVVVVEGKTTVVELGAKATLQVTGIVLGPDGKGVATEVSLRKPPGPRASFHFVPPHRTDAEGRFTLAIAKGATMMLEVKPIAGTLAPEPLEVKSTDDKLVLRLTKSPMVRGQVVDSAGKPITRFTIDGAEHEDDDGRFELPFAARSRSVSNGVTRVSMRLSLRAEGFVPRSHEVDQPTGDVDVGRLVLEQKRDVVVLVRSANGQPLAGARVTFAGARTAFFNRESDLTDVDGRFTLVDQPMAELKLVVRHPTAVTTFVTARSGETRVDVTLPAGLTVSGTVSGRQRTVAAEQGEAVELVAVEKGSFAFHTLTPGVWRLAALDLPMDLAEGERSRLQQWFRKDTTVQVTVGPNGATGVVLP